MRTSHLCLSTLKESPHDAEIISHQLMIRAGLIRKLASGLYTWLPMGLRVLRKVEKVIREEMENIQAAEVLMPAVQPAELWQETGRWAQFGPQLLKIKDRHKREFCFGPTHEEVITDLVRRELKSYKQLPLTLYQIQMKFRDEIRPRFGVMRAREFLMKDAYSFHIDGASLQATYEKMYEAYSTIFTRLGLKFRAVMADTGSIGGSLSHEFHVLAESGEDLIAYNESGTYAANVELAEAVSLTDPLLPMKENKRAISMPSIRAVEEQARHLQVGTQHILKTLLVKGRTEEHPIVALLLRGDHELNALKAEKHPFVFSPLTLATPEEIKAHVACGPGFIGPAHLNLPLIADRAASQMRDFICGANEEDTLFAGFNWGKDATLTDVFDLRQVQAGDQSPDGQGTLQLARGIEVGHIFQLGNKYSQAMNATVLDDQGRPVSLTMGCYGIGVSRLVAAAIEQNHDERGIIWPSALSPFQIILIPIQLHQSDAVREATLTLYAQLKSLKIEVLLDDRLERPGVLFNDADLLGIPHRIVLSEKTLAQQSVEYKARTEGASELILLDHALPFIQKVLMENP